MSVETHCAHCGKQRLHLLSESCSGFRLTLCSDCWDLLFRVLDSFTPHRQGQDWTKVRSTPRTVAKRPSRKSSAGRSTSQGAGLAADDLSTLNFPRILRVFGLHPEI